MSKLDEIKIAKATKICPWCGKHLVFEELRSGKARLSCSVYEINCLFLAYYTKAELQQLNEAKAFKEMEKTEEREPR